MLQAEQSESVILSICAIQVLFFPNKKAQIDFLMSFFAISVLLGPKVGSSDCSDCKNDIRNSLFTSGLEFWAKMGYKSSTQIARVG